MIKKDKKKGVLNSNMNISRSNKKILLFGLLFAFCILMAVNVKADTQLGDILNPNITLTFPWDGYVFDTNNVTLNCSIWDDVAVSNVSVWHNITGGNWGLNQTNTSALNDTQYKWDFTNLDNGTYLWTCEAYDNSSNMSTHGNYTFEVAWTTSEPADNPPEISSVPANISQNNVTSLLADFDASDDNGISTWFLNDTTYFNMNSSGHIFNTTDLTTVIGNFSYNVSVNDTINQLVSTVFNIEIYSNYVPDVIEPNASFFFHKIIGDSAGYYSIPWAHKQAIVSDNGSAFVLIINITGDDSLIVAYTTEANPNNASDWTYTTVLSTVKGLINDSSVSTMRGATLGIDRGRKIIGILYGDTLPRYIQLNYSDENGGASNVLDADKWTSINSTKGYNNFGTGRANFPSLQYDDLGNVYAITGRGNGYPTQFRQGTVDGWDTLIDIGQGADELLSQELLYVNGTLYIAGTNVTPNPDTGVMYNCSTSTNCSNVSNWYGMGTILQNNSVGVSHSSMTSDWKGRLYISSKQSSSQYLSFFNYQNETGWVYPNQSHHSNYGRYLTTLSGTPDNVIKLGGAGNPDTRQYNFKDDLFENENQPPVGDPPNKQYYSCEKYQWWGRDRLFCVGYYTDGDVYFYALETKRGNPWWALNQVNEYPVVNLTSPIADYLSTNTGVTLINITHNISVTDDAGIVNCSLYHNITGTWHLNQTQNLSGISTTTSFNITNINNRSYVWTARCWDSEGLAYFSEENRTVGIWIDDTNVTLLLPANAGSQSDDTWINFTYNLSASKNYNGTKLYINMSGIDFFYNESGDNKSSVQISNGRWYGRPVLTNTTNDVWIMIYRNASTHGSDMNDTWIIKYSEDEGDTWTEKNTYINGSPTIGFPFGDTDSRGEQDCDIITYPNEDIEIQCLIYNSTSVDGSIHIFSYDKGYSWENDSAVNWTDTGGWDDGTLLLAQDHTHFNLTTTYYTLHGYGEGADNTLLARSDDFGKTYRLVRNLSKGSTNEAGIETIDGDDMLVILRHDDAYKTFKMIVYDNETSTSALTDVTLDFDGETFQRPRLVKFSDGYIRMVGRNGGVGDVYEQAGLWITKNGTHIYDVKEFGEYSDAGYSDIMEGGIYYQNYFITYEGTADVNSYRFNVSLIDKEDWRGIITNTTFLEDATEEYFERNFTNATLPYYFKWNVQLITTDNEIYWGGDNRTYTIQAGDIEAPQITNVPENQTLEYATDYLMADFNATDDTAVSSWSVNDSTNFKINTSGMLENNSDSVDVGTHILMVNVSDAVGNQNSTLFIVTYQDTTLPTIDIIAPNQSILWDTEFFADINGSDASGLNTTPYKINDTNFNISNEGMWQNNTVLPVGIYIINVSVIDAVGLVNSTAYRYEVVPRNTSFKSIEIKIKEVDFNSAEDIEVALDFFNASIAQNATIRGGGAISKSSGGASSEFFMVIRVNDVVELNQSIRTVAGLSDKGVFTIPPTQIPIVVGENNITIFFRETGSGAVNISNFDLHGDSGVSDENNTVEEIIANANITFSSTSFINIVNFSINKTYNVSTLIDVHHRFTTDSTSTTPECYLENSITGETTSSYSRWLETSSDIGSSGINCLTKTTTMRNETWLMYCKSSDADNIMNNITISIIELGDDQGNVINGFQNETRALQSISGSNNLIASFNDYMVEDGDQIEMFATIIAQSTSGKQNGDDSPYFFINGTGLGLNNTNCFYSVERSLDTANDVGTIKMYANCENVSIGELYNLSVYSNVASGETLNILNTSFSGYENVFYSLVEGNLPPIVLIDFPTNNSNVSGLNKYINFTESDPNNNIETCNVLLLNFSETVVDYIKNATNDDFMVNWSDYTIGDYLLRISCNDTMKAIGNATINITILDSIAPNIIQPINITLELKTDSLSTDFNYTDESPVNFSINDTTRFTMYENGTLLNKTSLDLGIYTINVSCNDSLNNLNSTIYMVTVSDTIAPNINDKANQTLEYLTDSLSVVWSGSDFDSTITYHQNDTTRFNMTMDGVLTNITATPIGIYTLNVSLNDTSNNLNSTIFMITVQDSSAPTITIETINPYQNPTILNITAIITDLSPISNISINDSNFTYHNISGYHSFINNTKLPDSNITISIRANDTSNNINSENITISIDTIGPAITLINPESASTSTTSSIDFQFRVNDTSTFQNCSLNLNGIISETLTAPARDTALSITKSLSNNNYQWNITCYDKAQNKNTSATRTFTISSNGDDDDDADGSSGTGTTGGSNERTFTVEYSSIWYTNTSEVITIKPTLNNNPVYVQPDTIDIEYDQDSLRLDSLTEENKVYKAKFYVRNQNASNQIITIKANTKEKEIEFKIREKGSVIENLITTMQEAPESVRRQAEKGFTTENMIALAFLTVFILSGMVAGSVYIDKQLKKRNKSQNYYNPK